MHTQPSCFHCEQAVVNPGRYTLLVNQEQQQFCCPACLAITETILGSGLAEYYQQRENAAPTPSRGEYALWDNKTLQEGFVNFIQSNAKSTEKKQHNAHTNSNSQPPKQALEASTAQAKLYIEGMHCSACAWLIEKSLEKLEAIISAEVDYAQECLSITWHIDQAPLSQVMQHIDFIGYTPHPYREDQIKQIQKQSERTMLKRLGITGILMMQIGMLSLGLYTGKAWGIDPHYESLLRAFTLLFSIPLLYYSALPFISRAIVNLEHKQLGMDVNIAIAIIGLFISSAYAVIYSTGEIYFDSVAMLCFFILLARFIENKSRMRLRSHTTFLPRIAHKIQGKSLLETPLHELQPGDYIRVQQGEVIPVDGQVLQGQSTVSESLLTGESKPITKQKNDTVLAGSQNHDGVLDVKMLKKSSDSLARNIERFLQRSSKDKPRSVSLSNQISHHFSWIIIGLSLASFAYWFYMDNPDAYWIALSVLVVSCPCALSLAAPTALSAIQSRLRKQGIVIQKPSTIENLIHAQHVIFDKTGTITQGAFSIRQCKNLSNYSEPKLDYFAACLESASRHPISQAFKNTSDIATNIQVFLHQGVEGSIDDKRYRIGSATFCKHWHPEIQAPILDDQQDITQSQWIGLCDQENFLCWYLLEDNIRDSADTVIDYLQAKGIEQSLISGDQKNQVQQTANFLGIQNYYYLQSSLDKLKQLQLLQQSGTKVLTIGDGVNDAPVLSQSYVSATFSNACDWVKNTADIIILDHSLLPIKTLFQACEHYRKILKQNFAWAIAYNILAIPFAMAGYVTPWMAALGMSISSLIVVFNSYRLVSSTKSA